MPQATLTILPWVRQGVASAIDAPDPLETPSGPAGAPLAARAAIPTSVTLNDEPVPTVVAQLFGPADVAGIDARQIIRTEPVAGTVDFEPNFFALIEFDRPDFPWLFTPLSANADSRLRPWLCLVVVKKQPGITFGSPADSPLPVLEVQSPASASDELPALQDCWAWAHAQAIPTDASHASLAQALDRQPERSLSRLVCARVLEPNVDYLACVVPTFELGRRAGLGQAVTEADLRGPEALAPAWRDGGAAQGVRLPVYHHWEFRTGSAGDFESLVRQLRPAVVPGLGQQEIDISRPGFDAGGASTTHLQGALAPWSGSNDDDLEPPPATFRWSLATIVNSPHAGTSDEPALAPPIYGGVHAGRDHVDPTGATWIDELNTDPRWRIAASRGTGLVQHHQQALLAAAWEQAGDAGMANQRLRQMELGAAATESLRRRHLQALTDEQMTRFAAPSFAALRLPSGESMRTVQAASRLPLESNGFAMRRLARLRGPLTRKLAAHGVKRSGATSWVARLNSAADPVGTTRPPAPARTMCGVAELPGADLALASHHGVFWVAAEGAALATSDAPVRIQGATELPGHFRAAARAHLAVAFPTRSSHAVNDSPPLAGVREAVLGQSASAAGAALMRSSIVASPGIQSMSAGDGPVSGLETMVFTPRFEQAMCETLVELYPDCLLPGVERVERNTVVGLQTNSRFVDAFMVGLNHEMSRELLWHGFPADLRGTFFSTFWPSPAGAAWPDIHTWGPRALGQAEPDAVRDTFVMLIRSALLQRYPNALVYLAPANALPNAPRPEPGLRTPDLSRALPPVLLGRALSDITYFGFGVSPAQASGADGGAGYFVVIEEQASAPRFGFDVGVGVATGKQVRLRDGPPDGLDLGAFVWGKNSAHMAALTRQPPVRIAIHASALL